MAGASQAYAVIIVDIKGFLDIRHRTVVGVEGLHIAEMWCDFKDALCAKFAP